MNLRARYTLLAAVGVALACASGSGGGATTPHRDSLRITRAELDELHEMGVRNLYEAIDRIRARWLVVRSGMRSFNRGTEIVVFQDDAFLGNTDALERMGLEGVYEIRYLDGATAQATLLGIGDRHVEGAIVVYMRPPRGS